MTVKVITTPVACRKADYMAQHIVNELDGVGSVLDIEIFDLAHDSFPLRLVLLGPFFIFVGGFRPELRELPE